MKFLDQVKIYVKAGDGGKGSASFRREKFIEFGGPNGGDGGKGGSIKLVCEKNLNTLIDFRYRQHFNAERGGDGKGQNKTGKSGSDLILKIPIGNTRFKSSTNRAPRKITKGALGEDFWIWLQLKTIADIGIIGLPNAGKSSLLAALTKAKPKIANYQFTTLNPNLGVTSYDNKELTLADIPGLIEGANEGVGLGYKFLKHIERCKNLLHLIDITETNLLKCYFQVRKELKKYSDKLINKKEIVVLNKTDLIDKEEILKITNELKKKIKTKIFIISTVKKEGLLDLKKILISNVYK